MNNSQNPPNPPEIEDKIMHDISRSDFVKLVYSEYWGKGKNNDELYDKFDEILKEAIQKGFTAGQNALLKEQEGKGVRVWNGKDIRNAYKEGKSAQIKEDLEEIDKWIDSKFHQSEVSYKMGDWFSNLDSEEEEVWTNRLDELKSNITKIGTEKK